VDNLVIKASKYTPAILFDAKAHTLDIKGESYPENISDFYGPAIGWMESYLKEIADNQSVTVNIEMVYFNSNTSKTFMNIFDMLQDSAIEGKKIIINWYYDKDNDISLENGKEFQDDFESLTFNLIQTGKQTGD